MNDFEFRVQFMPCLSSLMKATQKELNAQQKDQVITYLCNHLGRSLGLKAEEYTQKVKTEGEFYGKGM